MKHLKKSRIRQLALRNAPHLKDFGGLDDASSSTQVMH